jgi:hypothetical protein
MAQARKLKVTSPTSRVFEVDITDKALRRFGFRHGDYVRLRLPIFKTQHYSEWRSARIIGVARESEWNQTGRRVLWVAPVGDRGNVVYVEFPKKGKNIILVKKMVTSLNGHNFLVDVSKKAVGRFGFRHGQRVMVRTDGCWHPAIIRGVARAYEWNKIGRKVLWYALPEKGGRVAYSNWSEDIYKV